MEQSTNLILASTSRFRKSLLENAGVAFQVSAPQIDERAISVPMEARGADPRTIASVLAAAKALDVSKNFPDAFVLGSDQTMALGSQMFHKPKNIDDARSQIATLQGKIHALHSAVAIVKNSEIIWSGLSSAHLTMRVLNDTQIDAYITKAGESVLWSVGAYQIESLGVTLFEHIDGDYFTIIGLPMLPLLEALRELEIINE